MEKKYAKQYNSIDLVKLFMSIVVVAIHTKPFVNVNNSIVLGVYGVITDLAVPFFFIASGYLLFNQITLMPEIEQKNKMRAYAIKTIRMYILWTIIYLPITIYAYSMNGEGALRDILAFIKGLLFVGCHWNSYPLWYLLSTFYTVVVLYLLIYRMKMPYPTIFVLSGIVFVGANLFTQMSGNIDNISVGGLYRLLKVGILIFGNGRIFVGFFYMTVGFCIAKYCKLNSRIVAITALIFLLTAIGKSLTSGIIERCMLAVAAVGFFVLVISVKLPDAKIWIYCRKCSTHIFLLHMFVYTIITVLILNDRFANGLGCFGATLILTLFLSAFQIQFRERHV